MNSSAITSTFAGSTKNTMITTANITFTNPAVTTSTTTFSPPYVSGIRPSIPTNGSALSPPETTPSPSNNQKPSFAHNIDSGQIKKRVRIDVADDIPIQNRNDLRANSHQTTMDVQTNNFNFD
eukprot:TRINITY_DN10205_c0_g2_i1.p1 TRINITY_DN10205_c0_g2~~TRINITY_DN10205_c0_g2_i1.p1  ORF type:complete len:123 (+),score=4.00 TRINITY_DN10205_c0_g2_i1:173-541(+)